MPKPTPSSTGRPMSPEIMPEFIRLPKPGLLCPYTGLSRSKMNELILPNPHNNFKPPVRSICLRNRGKKKAVRLIVFESLMEYLRSFADPAQSAPNAAG
jgi:hypothetical protein